MDKVKQGAEQVMNKVCGSILQEASPPHPVNSPYDSTTTTKKANLTSQETREDSAATTTTHTVKEAIKEALEATTTTLTDREVTKEALEATMTLPSVPEEATRRDSEETTTVIRSGLVTTTLSDPEATLALTLATNLELEDTEDKDKTRPLVLETKQVDSTLPTRADSVVTRTAPSVVTKVVTTLDPTRTARSEVNRTTRLEASKATRLAETKAVTTSTLTRTTITSVRDRESFTVRKFETIRSNERRSAAMIYEGVC
ncbi:hypothetical protein BD324DRAFT_630916, partial [Kockovaella imperatae]